MQLIQLCQDLYSQHFIKDLKSWTREEESNYKSKISKQNDRMGTPDMWYTMFSVKMSSVSSLKMFIV